MKKKDSKVKPKLWMVEDGLSVMLGKISKKRKNSKS